MSMAGEQILLRAYVRSTDRHHLVPVYQGLVKHARQSKLAGATVLAGIIGLGSRGLIEPSEWKPVSATPMSVEIVDGAERIAEFVRGPVHEIMRHGMVTLERAGVMMYRHRTVADPAPSLELLAAMTPLSTVPQIEMRDHMTMNEDGVLLRIFAGDSDRFEKKPLHEAIVAKARELGLSGATVLRGTTGFGANSVLHTSNVLELSTDLPMVIELVDSEANIKKLLPHLETMVREGMITMEHVRILVYRRGVGQGSCSGGYAVQSNLVWRRFYAERGVKRGILLDFTGIGFRKIVD